MKLKNIVRNTWPYVIHGNGPSKNNSGWKQIVEAWKKQHWFEQKPDNLAIITWSIPDEDTILEECLGSDLTVIPMSKPFPWGDKISKTLEYLYTLNKDKYKYVMGLDALDVIVSTDLDGEGQMWDDIIKLYNKSPFDIIYNAEKTCWPNHRTGLGTSLKEGYLVDELTRCIHIEEEIYKGMYKSDWCYLNSGCWIGRLDKVIEFYEEVHKLISEYPEAKLTEGFFGGDQGFIRALIPKFWPKVGIDYNCDIFQTLQEVECGTNIIKSERDTETGGRWSDKKVSPYSGRWVSAEVELIE